MRLRQFARWFVLAACLGVVVTLLATAAPSASAQHPGGPVFPAGCNSSQPGVMHHANGDTLGPAGGVPCLTYSFYGFGEANPVVASDGTVMYGGAYPPNSGVSNCTGYPICGNIARTADKGRTWEFQPLPTESPNGRGSGDPQLWSDPLTGRVFYTQIGSAFGFPPFPNPAAFLGLCQTELSFTDDGGQTWTTNYPLGFGCPAFDFPKPFTGPPTTSSDKAALSKPGAYPDVLYICKSSHLPPTPRQCWKSLDSGATFTEIAGSPTADTAGAMGASTADLHGLVYGVANGNLNISPDEGITWHSNPVPPGFGSSSLAVDRDGNVYLGAAVNKLPEVTYSTDHGQTWSTPIAVEMPGVHQVHKPVLAVPPLGAPGRVAVAYIGNSETSENPVPQTWTCAVPALPCGRVGGVYHGYITTTVNLLAANPVFRSVQVDNDADPLLPYGYNPGGATVTSSRADYIGIYTDDAGTTWAYFYKDACVTEGNCTIPNPWPTWTNWVGAVATVAPRGFAHVPAG